MSTQLIRSNQDQILTHLREPLVSCLMNRDMNRDPGVRSSGPPAPICPPGVRNPLDTRFDPAKRTIYIGHLPPGCKPKDIMDVIKGGPIERLGIVPNKDCAFLKFIYADDADEFFSRKNGKMRVLDAQVSIGWGNEKAPHSPHLLNAVYAGATRNVFLGRLSEDVTAAKLADELKEFGIIEKVDVLINKKIAFIHFAGIFSAVNCVKKLRERRDGVWSQRNINYGIDRCTVGWNPNNVFPPLSPRGRKRRRDSPLRRSHSPRHISSRHSSSRHSFRHSPPRHSPPRRSSPRHSPLRHSPPRRLDRRYHAHDRERDDRSRERDWNRKHDHEYREREKVRDRDRDHLYPEREYYKEPREREYFKEPQEHERYQNLPKEPFEDIALDRPPSVPYPTSPLVPVKLEKDVNSYLPFSPPKGGLTERERKELQELRELREMRDRLTKEELHELKELRKLRDRGELGGLGQFVEPKEMRREVHITEQMPPREPRRPKEMRRREATIHDVMPPLPGVRDPLDTSLDPSRRIIYLGRLPKECHAKEILDAVQEGPLESLGLLRAKDCAFVKFLYAEDAADFFYRATTQKFSIKGFQKVKVAWGKESAPITPDLLNVIRAGATRNVFIGGLTENISAGELRKELRHFGNIEKVDVLPKKQIAFLHFHDLMSAVDCVGRLRGSKESKWLKRTINYGPDRCDGARKRSGRQDSARMQMS